MNTSRKGRSREWQIRKFLEEKGYWVVRAAASKGPFDLVGFNHACVVLVQSKANLWPPPKERKTLEQVKACASVIKLLARVDDGAGSRKAEMRWRIFWDQRWREAVWAFNVKTATDEPVPIMPAEDLRC